MFDRITIAVNLIGINRLEEVISQAVSEIQTLGLTAAKASINRANHSTDIMIGELIGAFF